MDNILNDFLWGLSNCDKVIVVLTGVGEKEFSTKEIYEAIDKLKIKTEKIEYTKQELTEEIERAENMIVKMGWCTYGENKKYEKGLKFALDLLNV